MQADIKATTLSFSNLHAHGPLMADLLRARHRTFVERAGWDLPSADGMEFDQYDTPASRWVVVHENGRVRAGVRLTPTTHRCGIYTYMIRDAQLGLLDTIPQDLLFEEAPVAETIWESSRVFVCDDCSARERMRVHRQLNEEMIKSAREVGATSIIGMIPEHSLRLCRRYGLDVRPAGRVVDFGDFQSVAVVIDMVNKLH
nr:acyl-homoserine-lactone synthase [Jannaschia sp. Os4]